MVLDNAKYPGWFIATGCFFGFAFLLVLPSDVWGLHLLSSTTYHGPANGTDAGFDLAVDASGNVWVLGITDDPTKSRLAKYDSSLTLLTSTISPGPWFTHFSIDSSGNIWVVGGYTSSNEDIWIGKYNSSLVLQSSTTVNGPVNRDDSGTGIFVDSNGTVWVVGDMATLATSPGRIAVWVAKYTSSLVLLSSATFLHPQDNHVVSKGLTVTSGGDVWIVGFLWPCPAGNFCSRDIWAAKYDASLVFQGSTTVKSPYGGEAFGHALVSDGNSNVYLVGDVDRTTYPPGDDIWIGKYDPFLVLKASAIFDGSLNESDYAFGVALDKLGGVWIAGQTKAPSSGGKADILVAEYDSSLVLRSSASIDGSSSLNDNDMGYGIAFGPDGSLWVTGRVNGAGSPPFSGSDLWLAKFAGDLVPYQPALPSGLALGISSISWSWQATYRTTSYYVITPAGSQASPKLSSTTLSWTEIDFSTNTAITRALVAANTYGASTSTFLTRYTLAYPPSGLAATAVYVSSLTLSWNLNTNPVGTWFQVERSTDDASYISFFSSSSLSFTDTGLQACTSYYHRVRAMNGTGVLTAFNGPVTSLTQKSTPIAPSNLIAIPLEGNKIQLTWTSSPDVDVRRYAIYYDNGTGTINYTTPLAVLTSTVTSYATGALTGNTTYKFGLRAQNRCDVEEKNLNVTASATTVAALSGIRAVIKIPEGGKKLSGNRVLVMAELILGTPGSVKNVLFQYKSSASATWLDIPAAVFDHPNPDPEFPYFIHWDISNSATYPTGDYNLRAVAVDLNNQGDPIPPSITVTIDPADPDVEEKDLGNNNLQKRQKIANTLTSTINAGDLQKSLLTQVTIPAGALSGSTATVKVVLSPPNPPAPPEGAASPGVFREISLETGQTQLSGGQTATLVIPYPDEDNDDLVDGTTARVDKLAIYSFNSSTNRWERDVPSSVDKAGKVVTGNTPHFSLFGLFAPAAADLSSVLVYPVPFVPNDGLDDNGKPFASGDSNSGIIFDSITQSVVIRVYAVTGELVWERSSAASSGKVQWDGRNLSGQEVASGVYVAVISTPETGSKVVRKIVIVR